MITIRSLTIVIFCSVLLTSLTHAQDLSRYRDFQFGMNLPTVAKQADLKQSDARAVHQRPAIIEELEWRPQSFLRTSPQLKVIRSKMSSSVSPNGELFRMVVNYDPDKTQGLTNDDMVSAISATYGTASRPVAKTISFSSAQGYSETEKVMARWEDSQYSFNLFPLLLQP
jgi:hypothetical protein